jgi:hypothetical protein
MYEREGFMSPDTLLEALVPFMDTGPNDPGAGALAHRAVRRKAAGEWLEGGGGCWEGRERGEGGGQPGAETVLLDKGCRGMDGCSVLRVKLMHGHGRRVS